MINKLCLRLVHASGSTPRSLDAPHEFWMFYLFMNIVLYVPLLIGLSLLTDDSTAGAGIFFIVISIILTIGLVIPHLAVCVRRLHDIGQSGSYLLMSLIPFAGPIIMLVAFAKDSQPGKNQYGISEKYPES